MIIRRLRGTAVAETLVGDPDHPHTIQAGLGADAKVGGGTADGRIGEAGNGSVRSGSIIV